MKKKQLKLFSIHFDLSFAMQVFLVLLPQMIDILKQCLTTNYIHFGTKVDQQNLTANET